MATNMETLHQELVEIKKDVELIKNILREEYGLSDTAKKALREARDTPESDYVDLE